MQRFRLRAIAASGDLLFVGSSPVVCRRQLRLWISCCSHHASFRINPAVLIGGDPNTCSGQGTNQKFDWQLFVSRGFKCSGDLFFKLGYLLVRDALHSQTACSLASVAESKAGLFVKLSGFKPMRVPTIFLALPSCPLMPGQPALRRQLFPHKWISEMLRRYN